MRRLSKDMLLALLVLTGCGGSGAVTTPAATTEGRTVVVAERAPRPEPPELALALGPSHLCVLRRGRVACRGRNEHGQLGDRTTEARAELVDVEGIDDAMAIAAGPTATCALRADRSVWCWGRLGGMERWTEPTELEPLAGAREVVVSGEAVYSRDANGGVRELSASERDRAGYPGTAEDAYRVSGVRGVRQLAAAFNHGCGLLDDGGVVCWAVHGLPIPSGGDAIHPVRVPGVDGAIAVAAGLSRACALARDGRVRCWRERVEIVPLRLEGAIGLAVGDTHLCVWDAEGAARCHGDNRFGRLGDGLGDAPTQTPRGLAPVRAMQAAAATTCAVTDDGPRCWGSRPNPVGGSWPSFRPVPTPLAGLGGEPPRSPLIFEGPLDPPPPEATPGIRLRRASVDAAGRLLAELFRANVVVLAPADARVDSALPRGSAADAFDALAAEAGLEHAVWGRGRAAIHVLAPAARLAAADGVSAAGLAGGRRVDLDLERVRAHDVLRLLSEVSGLELEGGLPGEVTIRGRGLPATATLAALCRLTGIAAARRGRRLSLDGAAPPATSPEPPSDPSPPARNTHMRRAELLTLELVGVAHDGRVARALLSAPERAAGIVRRGDYLGAPELVYAYANDEPLPVSIHWRVRHVSDDAVILGREDPTRVGSHVLLRRLELGAPAPALDALGPF